MLIDNKTYAPGKTTTTLKPSQAMRIGAALRPQCRGPLWAEGKSCALAAMYEGLGGKYGASMNQVFEATRPLCPGLTWMRISWKNDALGWSRERTADWLESRGL